MLETLDGTVSCSVIIDHDLVRRGFESTPSGVQPDLISAEEFWTTEFTSGLPVTTRIEDLIIYELHVGSLRFGKDGVGNLSDALSFLYHLVDLGVNAIELLDNGSTGFTPRFWEENVRQQFISVAAFLIEEMHVDGLRVDLTQAIYRDNALHANGQSIHNANIFGQKFLREWSRTLHMIRPTTMLIAEDHTGWDAVTKSPAQGGLGFNAKWELAFYHSLIGDSDMAGDRARLLKQVGSGGNEAIKMDQFSGVLFGSRNDQVIFHESHDEAGNAGGTARTMVTAVNGFLFDNTRPWAEARSRVCFGLSLLSAGTPMFFMGEEIGAQKQYTYDNFVSNREDILGERDGNGNKLFRFYQELITLSRRLRSIRSDNIDIIHQSNSNRVIAFKRWSGEEEVIIVASLNNTAFAYGYVIQKDWLAIPNARWKEVFNSDAAVYGGQNAGNGGGIIHSYQGNLNVVIPANGFVVFVKQ
jgi:1,4-alpha-glucan branching enzyme